ncbi:nitroreductase/quinone reductase family protein [Streptomyces marincola]|uniref:nitroreductase/quinone reductase family protein n=1 Tax=Streptomyces marincola TaxID=2878388 RepID=UPI001CF15680|nr:nitroreductase/quinone reductase family protein [Streptomyces marincola]UCM91300.1 nitroreductase/quinone reductase family protein [Streptomyces marincola]
MPQDPNRRIIEEFRANNGRVGGPFEGGRLILLTTTGARTGAPHTTPLGYLPDGDGRLLVIASAGGSPRHPDWYHNLLAEPKATVEDGVFTYGARATVLTGAARDEAFARAVESDPGWAAYQAKTSRVLPVVALREVDGGPPEAASPGAALTLVHDAFRRELGILRGEITASGPRLGAQLRINCLTACQGLRHHHAAEDGGLFPFLAGRHPHHAPVFERLEREHERVAGLLERLQDAVSRADAEPAALLAEVDTLIGALESHLAYEEEVLIPLLDARAP